LFPNLAELIRTRSKNWEGPRQVSLCWLCGWIGRPEGGVYMPDGFVRRRRCQHRRLER